LAFAACLPLLGYAAAVLVSGRALRLDVPVRVRRAALVVALAALALNWTAKLLWLGI
jgi:hypothetical protein